MLEKLLVLLLVASVVLAAGCIGSETESPPTQTGAMTEDGAFNAIEEEMNSAVEDIDLGDLEESIPE